MERERAWEGRERERLIFKDLAHGTVGSEIPGQGGGLETQRSVDEAVRCRNPSFMGTSVFSLRTAAALVAFLGRTVECWELCPVSTGACSGPLVSAWQSRFC